jgi:outer membrane biosynthesis protein TonB
MSDSFESEKNMKATGYTALICTLLMIILLYASWTRPVEVPPVVEEGIEVNLGNSDKGMGTDQPYLPGKPSAEDKEKYTPPKQAVVEKEPAKDVETDDNNKEEAPVVKKAVVTKPDATRIPDKEVVKKAVKPVKRPDPIPAPPKPPHPKATMGKVTSNGTGGNDADDFKPGGNEGVAGGKGDQGAPGGDPNSKNYTGGGHGNSGVVISRGLGGRHIVSTPSFTDEFNENAKVAVEVHVDENGNVTSADYDMRGSTTSSGTYVAIAKRKAMQVKFNAGSGESVGTIVFNFKIHN